MNDSYICKLRWESLNTVQSLIVNIKSLEKITGSAGSLAAATLLIFRRMRQFNLPSLAERDTPAGRNGSEGIAGGYANATGGKTKR
jgi:hypothetical protein